MGILKSAAERASLLKKVSFASIVLCVLVVLDIAVRKWPVNFIKGKELRERA